MDIKVFNDVVNQAVKDREKLHWFERGSIVADVDLGICWLHIHPYNGRFTELPIGTFQYSIERNKVVRYWANHG